MAAQLSFQEAVANRRSIYQLTKSSPISNDKILDIVHHTAKHLPSSFDSQTTRLVVLLGDEHDKFWEFVNEVLKPFLTTPEAEKSSKGRIAGFSAAKGTILFWESKIEVDKVAAKYPLYADRFPMWAEHTSAMHQFVLWTAFEAEGLGANLQHYNPLVDNKAKEHWGLDKDWDLKGQLVFGGLPADKKRDELLGPKDLAKRAERVKVFGA